jgi:Uma2 family endonuclease
MQAYQLATVTEAEFLAGPETLDKTELLDGAVIMAPARSLLHQDVLGRLVFHLRLWSETQAGPVFVGQSPVDVRFGPNRILQPDAFVLFGELDVTRPGPLDRVPDLLVEVHSPSDRVYDRVTKRLVYAEAGVREYWIVHLAGFLERWSGGGLTRHEVPIVDVASELLPGFALDLRTIFPKR